MGYDYDDDSGSGSSDVILSFLLGGLAGAALALLYAPRTGQETRELLNERLRDTAERGREMKEEALGRGRALVDEAAGYVDRKRQVVEQQKERVTAAVDAGRQAFRDERKRGGEGEA